MSERTLFIYIAVVLSFTLCPSNGKNETCQYNDSVSLEGVCYRRNFNKVTWRKARENCESWNGKLATFTSLDQMDKVFTALGMTKMYIWVNTTIGAYEMSAFKSDDYVDFVVQSLDCNVNMYQSLCMEISNNKSVNNATLSATINATEEVALTEEETTITIQKDICLHNDSVLVDGQCYQLSTIKFSWSDAPNYCKSRNATLAYISSATQGMKILKAFNVSVPKMWVIDSSEKAKEGFTYYIQEGDCERYTLGHLYEYLSRGNSLVLCEEKPVTTSVASESTTTIALTTKTASTSTAASTITQALTTELASSLTLSLTTTPPLTTTQKWISKPVSIRRPESNSITEVKRPEGNKISESNSGRYTFLKLGFKLTKLFKYSIFF